MKPSCSIIIATKDRPLCLKQMISSLIAQPQDIEVIIVDDNSIQSLENKAIVERYKNIIQISYTLFRDNKLSKSCLYPFRRGLELANSDLIKFCGDDDFLYPNSIYWELDYMRGHKEVDCFMSSYQIVSNSLMPSKDIYRVKDKVSLGDMKYGCWIPDYSMTKIKFWDGVTFYEDIGTRWLWACWREMMYKGMVVNGEPDYVTYLYRRHPNQISNTEEAQKNNKKLSPIFKLQDERYLK